MEKEQFCPICGEEANSSHHIKPRSQGGTDDSRNKVILCRQCHDVVEEWQEKTGKGLSPDMIEEIRRELHIKLEPDEKTGIRYSYHYREGHNFLAWIMLPGQTKRWINQWVDGEPESYYLARIHEEEQKQEQKQAELEKVSKAYLRRKSKVKRGRPKKDTIDTSYIEELVYNRGLSYRAASKQLHKEGFRITYRGIGMRLKKSPNYKPISQRECKHCDKLFTPKREKQIYCEKPCNLAHRRHKKELLELKKNIDT